MKYILKFPVLVCTGARGLPSNKFVEVEVDAEDEAQSVQEVARRLSMFGNYPCQCDPSC